METMDVCVSAGIFIIMKIMASLKDPNIYICIFYVYVKFCVYIYMYIYTHIYILLKFTLFSWPSAPASLFKLIIN